MKRLLTLQFILFILLLLPPLLHAEEPSWIGTLLEAVGEIDRQFYDEAEQRLDLWQGEETSAAAAGEAYDPAELFARALEENRDLALLNIEKNKMLIEKRGARARRFPTVDAQVGLTGIANPMEPISLTAGQLGVYTLAGEETLIPPEDMTIYEGMEGTQYNFKLIIDQPVFTWGKIKGAEEAATLGAEAGALRIQGKELELRADIYARMYALKYLSEIEAILSLQEKAAERLVKITEDSYENGFILYSELLDARIKAKELEIAAARIETEKNNLLVHLSYTAGIENLDEESLDFSPLDGNPGDITLGPKEELIATTLKDNPNIRLLELLQRIQALRRRIAEGDNYLKPDIGLHLELSYSGSRFPFIEADWYGQDRWNLTSTLGFSTTVFDGGQLMTSMLKSAQETEAALYEYRQGTETITRTITETLLKLELSLKNLEYYQLKSENGRTQLELKQTQFESGAGNETDYLMQKIDLYSTVIDYYRECITFYTNLFTLRALTGEFD